MKKGEEWRAVKGYEGYYEVSNYGSVRALRRVIEREGLPTMVREAHEMIVRRNKYYPSVVLTINTDMKHLYLHDLVAEAFLKKPEGGKYLVHKDGDTKNNKAENLKWICREMKKYAEEIAVQSRRKPQRAKPIVQLTADHHLIRRYNGVNSFKYTNFSPTMVQNSCDTGKLYQGCVWMYEEDYNRMYEV